MHGANMKIYKRSPTSDLSHVNPLYRSHTEETSVTFMQSATSTRGL